MKGISNKGTFSKDENLSKSKRTTDAMDMIGSIMSGKGIDTQGQAQGAQQPKLDFSDSSMGQEAQRMSNEEDLRSKAMQNLKERRLRLK